MKEAPTPKNKTGVRSFLGLAGYYRHFIRNFARISAPLNPITSPNTPFKWTDEAQAAFESLKESLTTTQVLTYPDFDQPFIVETDASSAAVGAVIAQKKEGRVHPVQFESRSLNAARKRYSACEREAVAVIFALRKFQVYLLSSLQFELVTDHQALKHSFAKRDIHGRLARWLDFLAEYDFRIVYKPGMDNKAADFLSREAHMAPAIDTGEDEGEMAFVVAEEPNLEPVLLGIRRNLLGKDMLVQDDHLRKNARRAAKAFLLWGDDLYRRTSLGPKIVLPKHFREQAIKIFHDHVGHWDITTPQQFIGERFWWPRMLQDVAAHVKSCKGCLLSSPLPRYRTTLRIPLTGLFHMFSIDFAGPLPAGDAGEKYLLIAVEHLTSCPLAVATFSDTSEVVCDFLREEIIRPFGPPHLIISDNAKAFTAGDVTDLMEAFWRPMEDRRGVRPQCRTAERNGW